MARIEITVFTNSRFLILDCNTDEVNPQGDTLLGQCFARAAVPATGYSVEVDTGDSIRFERVRENALTHDDFLRLLESKAKYSGFDLEFKR